MKALTRYIVVPFLFAMAGLLALPANAQDIVVGEFASLTGSQATFGINSSNGVELAKEEVNNAGGLLGGRKIKIIMEDDQSKPGQPSAAVKKLVASARAIAIFGEIASSRSLEAAPICRMRKSRWFHRDRQILP
jgi:branched-chain amino acid transport system substrate-binding protein